MKNLLYMTNNTRLIKNTKMSVIYGPLKFDSALPCRLKMRGYHIALSVSMIKENL